jgi:hypothetical protein
MNVHHKQLIQAIENSQLVVSGASFAKSFQLHNKF